jgi:hypothetical protein
VQNGAERVYGHGFVLGHGKAELFRNISSDYKDNNLTLLYGRTTSHFIKFIPVGQTKRGEGSESRGKRRLSHKILRMGHSNITSTSSNNRRQGRQTCCSRAGRWYCLCTQKCWRIREDDWAQWQGVSCIGAELPVKQGIPNLLIRVSKSFCNHEKRSKPF